MYVTQVLLLLCVFKWVGKCLASTRYCYKNHSDDDDDDDRDNDNYNGGGDAEVDDYYNHDHLWWRRWCKL